MLAKDRKNTQLPYKAINWNKVEDMVDKLTWEKLTMQFWLPERINVAGDINDWRMLTEKEKWVVSYSFGSLTLLDTLQSEEGVHSLLPSVRTQMENAILTNISFMESVHAKSYSTIFSTLNNKHEIEQIFDWVEKNEYLQYKAKKINEVYQMEGNPLKKKIASVYLESFLFYSGFYTPLRYLGNNKLSNVAEIIKLIRNSPVKAVML